MSSLKQSFKKPSGEFQNRSNDILATEVLPKFSETILGSKWELIIPAVPPSANILRHLHWAKYSQLMLDWFLYVRSANGFLSITRAEGKRWVKIVRYGKRSLDRDNLYSSMKPVVDVLKPAKDEYGVWKSGARKGQPWHRSRIGHGLILEDDETHLELKVLNGKLLPGQKPYTTILISDVPLE